MLDSTDPDLSQFARRGGKMIVTIGTDDTLASPGAQLDYYQSVLDKMGRRAVDSFARLFVIPQANHGLMARTADVDGAGKADGANHASDAVRAFRAARRLGGAPHCPGNDGHVERRQPHACRSVPTRSSRNTPAGMLLSRRPTAARTADSRGTSAGMHGRRGRSQRIQHEDTKLSKTTRRG